MQNAATALPPDEVDRLGKLFAAALTSGTSVGRPLTPHGALSLPDAYRVSASVGRHRAVAGEQRVGRKFGFTNRSIWELYGVDSAMFGDMFDDTVTRTDGSADCSLGRLSEPRLEPEIVLGLAAPPEPGAAPDALVDTIAWVALGCEIVQSVFPAWRFSIAESIASGGLHGRLLVGPPVEADAPGFRDLLRGLPELELVATRDGGEVARGHGRNALDGPLSALSHIAAEIGRYPEHPPLAAGETVTTGTVTDAFPVAPGETWTVSTPSGALRPLTVRFVA